MRYFKLINNNGAEYDITVRNSALLYNVSELGYDVEAQFERIGSRHGLISYNLAQKNIAGTVRFWQPRAEDAYFDFAQFCQIRPLRMVYSPDGAKEYFRDGIVSKIGKSDSSEGALKAEIIFSATSLWYKEFSEYNNATTDGEGKEYDYEYDYKYADTGTQTLTIMSDSYEDCPTRFTIYGYAKNPSWRHYVNNILTTTGKVTGEIEAGRKLVVDTIGDQYSIQQLDLADQIVSDLYQNSDFETGRFITLKHGENVISVAHEGAEAVRIAIEARVEYATV